MSVVKPYKYKMRFSELPAPGSTAASKGSARIYSPALADRGTPNSTSLRLNGLAALLCFIQNLSALLASSPSGHGLSVSLPASLSSLSQKVKERIEVMLLNFK